VRIVYLHGFASGPQSTKAQFFGRKFRETGVPFEAPELDRGQFENLTITGQLEVVHEAVTTASTPGPVILMGSSLGGYLAALYAGQHPLAVEKLVLLAPAFQFLERWRKRLSPEDLSRWQEQGWAPIFHYGTKTERRLGHQFLKDGEKYPPLPDFPQRALILHGKNDQVVPAEISCEYALKHERTRLVLLDSGHELTDVLEDLWRETAAFLGIV
jgi:pimeloyl-ACP methyl ester carboxylesterase